LSSAWLGRSTGKGTVTCALLWMRSMILRPGCWGQRWGDTGVCGAAVLLLANGIIRTAKQLPEVSRIAVWGQGCPLPGWVFLQLVGWQYAAATGTPLLGLDVLVANRIIRTAKQLPEVSRTAVWGRAALCLAGASCDWWGGNIEKYSDKSHIV
jgi:hypothetical protein